MSHNEINRKKFELKYNLDKVSFTFALIKKMNQKFREPRSSYLRKQGYYQIRLTEQIKNNR